MRPRLPLLVAAACAALLAACGDDAPREQSSRRAGALSSQTGREQREPSLLYVGRAGTANRRAATDDDDEREPRTALRGAAAVRADLESLLRQFSVASEATRARFVHAIRQRFRDFEQPLFDILSEQPQAPLSLLVPAVEVIGWLRLSEAQHELRTMAEAGPSALRAAAILALQRLDYWTAERVAQRLQTADTECLLALLEVAALLDHPPAAAIVPLLGHADANVRKAAAATFADAPGEAALKAIAAFTDEADGIQRIDAIRLLGRLDASPERDASLVRALQTGDLVQRQATLQALMQGDAQLQDADEVWKRIEDPNATVTELVHALAVLEQRNHVDVPRLVARLPRMHPVAKLHAARCLVRAGAAEGIPVLIGLLDTPGGTDIDDDDRACANNESRHILSELAGVDLGSSRGAWERWRGQVGPQPPTELTRPPRLSW